MLFATLVIVAVLVYLYLKKKRKTAEVVRDSTPALEAWVRAALEDELAEPVLGIRGATADERRKLAKTLAHEPDAEIVSKIEDEIRAVELEFLRYAHEKDVDVTLHVRYANGKTGTKTRRLVASEVPDAVREDFEKKGTTRVFRTWSFPWQQARSL